MTRLCGRSQCGTRLNASTPFGAWSTQTFIAGLTHDQLIAPWVIKGAMDGAAVAAYIREVLVPEIEPGTVVVCDNLAAHKTPKPPPHWKPMDAGSYTCRPTAQT